MPTPHAQPADGYAGDLTPTEAWALLEADDAAVLVDVRTDGEWRAIGVPDAPSAREVVFSQWVTSDGRPNPAFLGDLGAAGLEPGTARAVVFLCRSGQRSVAAARAATNAGLGPAYNVLDGFEGGLDAFGRRGAAGWRAEGLPSTTWTPAS